MIHPHRHRAKSISVLILMLGAVFAAASGATASVAGPRAGVSFDPDQVVLGGQIQAGILSPVLQFVPSLDFGFGNDITVVALNGDFHLKLFNLPNSNVRLYALGGPTISYFSPDKGDSDTEIGASVGGGLRVPLKGPSSYYIESRFGFGDIPDLKLIVGLLFGL